jgi:hypothetical protein
MSFRLGDCAIPTVWCGKSDTLPKANPKDMVKYVKVGSRYECMQKGYGAGMYGEKNKGLPRTSLQQIKYVGETYEANFKRNGISTTTQLVSKLKGQPKPVIQNTIKRSVTKKGGVVDKRAYNHCLVYLFVHGMNEESGENLPPCYRI